MEDQEASATKAAGEDNMPDGLEPVSPDSERVRPSGKPEAECPVSDLGDTISKKNEEAPKSCTDSNSAEGATKPESNDLTAVGESNADKLPANVKIGESDSVSAKNKSAIENNIDSPSEDVKDSVESALVETVDSEKSLDNLENESAAKDAVESEKGSEETSDDIDSKKPSDKVKCVKDIVNTEDDKTPKVFEADEVPTETVKEKRDPKDTDGKAEILESNVEKSEDNLLNSVSDSLRKDNINESGEILIDSKTVESNVESLEKGDAVKGNSGKGKETKQNGPEECPDERESSDKTKKHKGYDKTGGKNYNFFFFTKLACKFNDWHP